VLVISHAALPLISALPSPSLTPRACIRVSFLPWLLPAWAVLVALLLAGAVAIAALFRGARDLPGGRAAPRRYRLGRRPVLVTSIAFALAAAEAALAVAFALYDTYVTARLPCGFPEPVGYVPPRGPCVVENTLLAAAVALVLPAIGLLIAVVRLRARLGRRSG